MVSNKSKKIIIIGVLAVLVSLISFAVIEIEKTSAARLSTNNPKISYDDHKYKMGENVFVLGYGLAYTDVGTAQVFDPSGHMVLEIPFDGSKTSFVKSYFTPKVSQSDCGLDKIVGVWSVKFNGSRLPDYHFEIINQTLPGMEDKYLSGCKSAP